jgi:predicted O-methyltransferase YrrM
MIGIDAIQGNIELPEKLKTSAIKFSEGRHLHDLVRQNNFRKTLETGLGLGLSAASIITASRGRHVAVDPFQSDYDNCGLRNLERLGLAGELEFYADFSHSVLPRLLNEGRSFEFIFIDGNHRFDGQFVDFYYASLLIEQGGMIVLHDTWMRPTTYLVNYIKTNRRDFQHVAQGPRNIAAFRKSGDDRRNWMHFEGFGGSARSYATHKLIQTTHNEEDTLLKKTAVRLKGILR